VYSEKLRSYSFVTALLISGCVSASASVSVFTTRGSWISATTGVNNIDFEGLAAAGNVVQYNGIGGNQDTLTIGSVSFQGFDHASTTTSLDLEVNNSVPSWGTGAVLQGPGHFDSNSRIAATVGTGVFAIGSDVYNNAGGTRDTGTVNVVLSSGPTVYTVNTVAGLAFIGFVSDAPISSITFFPQGPDNAVIDNFSTGGQVNPAPEAATMLLCGTGILLMVWLFRRNQNWDAAPQGSTA
jgi:hypothetical protein